MTQTELSVRQRRHRAHALLTKTRPDGDCIVWTGSIGANGYGQYRTHDDNLTSHRLLWELVFGQVPEGMAIHHTCENRRCINPYHLKLLSPAAHLRHHRLLTACPKCGSSRWQQRYRSDGRPNGHRCMDCHARAERRRQRENG